jgi:ribonuclease P protein component
VSKRYGNAVVRNTMKRRMRAVIRDIPFKPDIDFFVVAKPKSARLSFSEIDKQLRMLFRRANIITEDKG